MHEGSLGASEEIRNKNHIFFDNRTMAWGVTNEAFLNLFRIKRGYKFHISISSKSVNGV